VRTLVIGSGAREHAIAWKLRQSPLVTDLFVAPGNGGTAAIAENVPIKATEISALCDWAVAHRIEFTFVGPDDPLGLGIIDAFQQAGLRAFGPTRAAAQIEASKAWAKAFMQRHGIPTARHATFHTPEEARAYIVRHPAPLVVKASGLAQGKGAFVCMTQDEALDVVRRLMGERVLGAAGETVVIEEYLEGVEVSAFAFCDGRHYVTMPLACDYKRLLDGDQGPNTGGMGSYAPPSFADASLRQRIEREILEPAVAGLAAEGRPFVGVLYAGLMITADGPKVLEFNCRLGDPEAQALLPLLESDLAQIALACLNGELTNDLLRWRPGAACAVVLASRGYPGQYETGFPIRGLDKIEPDVLVFHAGTALRPADGAQVLVTAGGRVLTVTAVAATLAEAREKVYRNAERVQFEGRHMRRDIAARELG
jgi:phosphoribosylamine--glycine ligase